MRLAVFQHKTDIGSLCARQAGLAMATFGATKPKAAIKSLYDAKSKQVSTWNLKNIPAEVAGNTVYMIERNPYDGSFYLAYTDYASNSTICHFTATGEYKSKFDAGGINANSMLFLR